jgi:competence protein ComEA
MVVAVTGVLGVRLAMASAAARPTPIAAETSTAGSDVAARAAATSTAPSAVSAGAVGSAASPTSSATGSAAAGAAHGAVVVYVSGRVRHPGVLSLAGGSRVQDALRAAGGALPGSDLTSINLAQPLTDGEQVLVARAGQGSSVSAGGQGPGSTAGTAGGGPGGGVVDLNTGDATALDSLPGVGPVLAQRIVDWRTAHGRFTSVDELDEVSGIGDKLMSEIRPHVRI